MKKLLLLLLFFTSIVSYGQYTNARIDSLKHLLSQSNGIQWIDVATELSSDISIQEPEYAKNLLADAIEFSKNIDYQEGLGNAYQVRALIYYENNKFLSGISYYEKAYHIFYKSDQHNEIAISIYGIAIGLSKIHRINESVDTLRYIINHYYDSLPANRKSNIYHLLSNIAQSEGENKIAIKYVDTAIMIEEEAGLQIHLANSYNTLGIIYSNISDFKSSLHYYDLFEENARQLDDTLSISYALHNKALIYLDWGVYDVSLSLFLESQSLVQAKGLNEELVSTKQAIASVYAEIGNNDKAKYYYYQALQLAEKYNDNLIKPVILHNIGELLFQELKYDSALTLLNTSLRYEIEDNNTLGIAESKSMIGTVNVALNKFNLAFTLYREAEKTFIKFGSKYNLASLYIDYAKAHQKLENDSLSVFYYLKGINLAEEIGARNLLLDGYKSASYNYERLHDYKNALFFYKESKKINDSIFSENTTTRMEYMTVKLEAQERDQEFTQLENEKKVLKLETKNRTTFLSAAIIILILITVFFYYRYTLRRKSEMRLSKQYDILLESDQKIKALLDASFDSTSLVNLSGNIVTINNNNLNNFFSDTKSMINKKLFSYFNSINKKMLEKFFELVLHSKQPKELQLHEKENIIFNIKISPVLGLNNEVSSLAFYIKDITQIEEDKEEKKKMQAQLIQTQKMETIGTLAGGIAHDFNNSLATISGYVSMSLEDVDPKSHVFRYLVNTKKAVVLAQATVKKLLAFSRSNEIIFNKLPFQLLLKDSIDMIKGSKPKNITLKYPTQEFNHEILADKNQLTQVIINICTNAFHAIDEEDGLVELNVSFTDSHSEFQQKRMIILEISDNGIGMNEETRKRIFEPFYTTKDVGKGTGLGLSVVSGIIKQHKGIIEVKSEFGKGTTFSLFLPLIS